MIKFFLIAMLMTVPVLPVWAQNDLALCKLRAQHTASPGAAYQPGVDVHGNPVMPADVNAAPSMVPDVIRIPMTVDLAQRLGTVPAGMELKADTGMVEIHKDGKVIFNGQDFTTQSVAVCGNEVPASAQAAIAPATEPPTKIIVPQDAPSMPMATVSVESSAPIVPDSAVVSPPLPPQTLGQLTIPAKEQPAPSVPVAPKAAAGMGERSNADLEKDDEIIWGQGN